MKIGQSRLRMLATIAGMGLVLTGASVAVGQGYYTQPAIFQPYPNENDKKPWNIQNFGPVGIGIDLTQPGFQMVISNVEKGSPAEQTGKLKKGQVIQSINGVTLKDRDPREIIGDILTDAEAKDGKIDLQIKDLGSVVVQIPVMGAYRETWPLNCPKSDKIVRELADLLAKDEKPKNGSIMFLLSTGEEKDLEVVRKWMKNLQTVGGLNWDKGFNGLGVCEYYLRTGDASVLPIIKQATEELKAVIYNGGWSGRGAAAAFTYSVGSGQNHASGVHCLTFLLMAKLCGVDVDETMLQESLTAFYRFSGHGNVAYGDCLPEGGYRDNGKTSGLAMAMAAAALVSPDGENSVYAHARDNCAIKSFYATNWFHVAHTGGGIGEIWHHMAMSLLHEKRPVQYRSYMDTRRWAMDLSRRFNGGIGIAGVTDRYDKSATEDERAWGTFFAMTYTAPRKTLQIYGAPRSPFAKHSRLPDRPWGNKTDDVFQLNDPIPGSSLTKQELLSETVQNDASLPASVRMNAPDVTDEQLIKYFHHPEFGLREGAIRSAVILGRHHLVLPLLKSGDARLRHVGVMAIVGQFKGTPMPVDKVTPEMWAEIEKMIQDPNESEWVLQDAIHALGRASPDMIARHTDRLVGLLGTKNWWTEMAAANTLANIAGDPKHYKTVLPKVIKHIADARSVQSLRPVNPLSIRLKDASPEVKAYAMKLLGEAYTQVPDEMKTPQGMVIPVGAQTIRSKLGDLILLLPGGTEFALKIPKTTLAYARSGQQKDLYRYTGFRLDKGLAGKWLFLTAMPENADLGKTVDAALKAIEKRKETQTGRNAYRPSYLVLKDNGQIDKTTFWSADTLVDLNTSEARKMMVRQLNGKEYLLVETGGFPTPDVEGWVLKYNVYERAR